MLSIIQTIICDPYSDYSEIILESRNFDRFAASNCELSRFNINIYINKTYLHIVNINCYKHAIVTCDKTNFHFVIFNCTSTSIWDSKLDNSKQLPWLIDIDNWRMDKERDIAQLICNSMLNAVEADRYLNLAFVSN